MSTGRPARPLGSWIRGAGRCALLVLAAAAAARAAEDVSVEATRRGSAVEVNCRATLQAPPALIWETLTDYDRLAQFIPGMHASRVVEQRGATAVVEQSGEARFLFVSFPIEVTVATTARPPHAIDVQVLKGNLKRLDGGYRIEPLPGGRTELRWSGLIEPAASLPPLIGVLLMRANIEDQFLGMVKEIERRDALWRAGGRQSR